MRHTEPSCSMCMPFLNWLVLTCSAIGGGNLANRHQLVREPGQHLDAVVRDDDEILDPDARDAAEIDPRLDRDDVARREHVLALRPKHRRLVDEQAETVPEPVAEVLAVTG